MVAPSATINGLFLSIRINLSGHSWFLLSAETSEQSSDPIPDQEYTPAEHQKQVNNPENNIRFHLLFPFQNKTRPPDGGLANV